MSTTALGSSCSIHESTRVGTTVDVSCMGKSKWGFVSALIGAPAHGLWARPPWLVGPLGWISSHQKKADVSCNLVV